MSPHGQSKRFWRKKRKGHGIHHLFQVIVVLHNAIIFAPICRVAKMILNSYFLSKLQSQGRSSVTPTSFGLSFGGVTPWPLAYAADTSFPLFKNIFGSVCFSRDKWCRTPTNLLPAFVFSGKTRNFCAHDSSINHDRGGGKGGEVKFLPWDWQRTRGKIKEEKPRRVGLVFSKEKYGKRWVFSLFPFCREQFNVRKSGKERRTFSILPQNCVFFSESELLLSGNRQDMPPPPSLLLLPFWRGESVV